MKKRLVGAVLILASIATPSLAQSARKAAARPPVVSSQHAIEIGGAFAEDLSSDREVFFIRRAKAIRHPITWLRESDAPIVSWRKSKDSFWIRFKLQTNATGGISQCTPAPSTSASAQSLATKLCPLIALRARFVPALNPEGSAVADSMEFGVSFKYLEQAGMSGLPLFQKPAAPPPVVPIASPLVLFWPPDPEWLRTFGRQPRFNSAVEQPSETPLAAPIIGLVISDPASQFPECEIVKGSGDAKLDGRACSHVLSKLQPQWSERELAPLRRWPLQLSPLGAGFRVVQPDASLFSFTEIPDNERSRLQALWRPIAGPAASVWLSGALGPDQRPANCMIIESSGNDAADTAACRLFRTEAKIRLGIDVFGFPRSMQASIDLSL